MVGLTPNALEFFIFYLILFLAGIAGTSIGLLVGSISKSPQMAAVIIPVFIMPMILFSGFYKNRSDIDRWIGWLEYLSPPKYSFNAIALN